ncbi:hypothetical protein QSV34_00010 [Porticoccus sp. W117]|uniref:hypothetical protein n=1 Tax=Porticoccus sp. W117 TaxID=3054777 RepID=UPI002597591D|nr:hypothetical protein [Porticoccus sp. W117]MDM3869724.1 hypothetical protein [Porticoccus sp. W117]
MLKVLKMSAVVAFFPVLAFANEVKSPEQQAIDDFKACVEQVISNGGSESTVVDQCSAAKAVLDSKIPGISDSIIHQLLHGDDI